MKKRGEKKMFKKIFTKQKERSFFEIVKNEDFYYLVTFKGETIIYTKTQQDANSLVGQIESRIDWSNYANFDQLFNDKTEYEKVRSVFRKYAVKVRKNGNYRNEQKETGVLKYRLEFGKLVISKEEIAPGVAIRESGGDFHVDLIFVGKEYTVFDTEEHAKKFIAKTQAWMPWHEENVMKIIEKEIEVKSYLKKLIWEINNEQELSKPSTEMVTEFLFSNFGESSQEKKAVYQETIEKMAGMVGLKQVKEYIQNMFKMISAEEKLRVLGIGKSNSEMHALFIGSAGTGKTVVARMYADILWSLNKIPERKLVEVSKEDLVSPYVGETEVKTKEVIEKALGGVLFVDEAYMLAGSTNPQGNDYGKIALEIIMRAMENERGNLVVVFAGYENDIEKLLDTNEGLRSRFSQKFRFEDYSPKELAKIAHIMIQAEGFETDDVVNEMEDLMDSQYKNNQMSGNARTVRKIASEIVSNHKIRMVEKNGSFYKINPEDVKVIGKRKMARSEETMLEMQKRAIEKLTNLVGLGKLKEEIKTWSNYIKIEKKREELNLNSDRITLHMAFKGAPGTGKTTVARIMGDILQSNGLLSRGHFKEVTRSDLVAEYMGQTSIKVKKLFREMEGGILFIDEAYSLVQNEDDSFGKEAVDTIIAEMENRRDDLVVILAGYSDEIDKLLETNPGFNSRINNHFEFPDYNSIELYELLKLTLKGRNLKLSSEAEVEVKKYIQMEKEQNKVDGNGRWVRNLVDKMKKNQANRLSQGNEFTEEKLISIEKEDIL
jgi:AAA+ superfamily predicted ATPase